MGLIIEVLELNCHYLQEKLLSWSEAPTVRKMSERMIKRITASLLALGEFVEGAPRSSLEYILRFPSLFITLNAIFVCTSYFNQHDSDVDVRVLRETGAACAP